MHLNTMTLVVCDACVTELVFFWIVTSNPSNKQGNPWQKKKTEEAGSTTVCMARGCGSKKHRLEIHHE